MRSTCCPHGSLSNLGKGKESDPTDASVDMSANASVDTLPTRRPTHYRHTTNAFIEKLTFPNSHFVKSFSLKQEQRHKKGGKHTDTFIEKLTFPNSYFVTSFSRKQDQRHKK